MAYPASEPYDEGYLKVSDLHTLYYIQCGNPDGKPVLFLHGGPGGSIGTSSTVFFNPKIYRIILFCQRGAGKSTPLAETKENTTWDLVGDIETLREKMKVDKWLVFGGSWGSTLALAYSQKYPDRCKGLVLRGLWLCRKVDSAWEGENGRRNLFPEAWEEYINYIPSSERSNVFEAYRRRLNSTDRKAQLEAARAWNAYEMHIGQVLPPGPEAFEKLNDDDWSLSHAVLECHYFKNRCWLEDGQLIKKENIDLIRHLPCILVQGRYDCCCPPRMAWDFHKAWPEAELLMIPDAGHSVSEPGIKAALIEATDKFSNL